MLHILLLILKIIGIILAVILGILVLLICIVIFVPVRYEINGRCGGTLETLKAKVRVTWFFRLVRADIYYKDNKLKWRFRIAWKKVIGGQKFGSDISSDDVKVEDIDEYIDQYMQDKDYAEKNTERDVKDDEDQKTERVNEQPKQIVEDEKDEKEPEEAFKEPGKDEKSSEEASEKQKKTSQDVEEAESEDERGHKEDKESGKRRGIKISGKIKSFLEKIKCTIRNIYAKIKELSEKKDKIMEFVQNETHVGALLKLKKEALKLLKRLRPKRFLVKAVFGFNNPARTGYTLAFLALLYPTFGDNVSVQPDFEKRILKGTVYGKGHIRLCYFAALAWNLLWCRNIRRTYKDIKNFEL